MVSHNEGENLLATVRSLLETLPPEGELLVLDDGSTDGSVEEAARRYPWIRVVTPKERMGVARARNLGAAHSSGRVIVWSDAHVAAPPGWACAMLRVLEERTVGAVSPVISVMGQQDSKAFGFRWSDAALNIEWLGWQGDLPHPVPMLPGAFLAMRRDVFEETGGFDPGMVLYGGEDAELSLRLWTLGYECRLVPEVDVAHLFRDKLPYAVGWESVLHNLLRVAVVHFSPARLERVIDCLSRRPGLPSALSRLFESDVWQRREHVRAARQHDDEWFFRRFGETV